MWRRAAEKDESQQFLGQLKRINERLLLSPDAGNKSLSCRLAADVWREDKASAGMREASCSGFIGTIIVKHKAP